MSAWPHTDAPDAELEAGARAITALCEGRRWADLTPLECAEAVLDAVLPEHDARVRADERARVRQLVEAERLVDGTGSRSRITYNQAIDDTLAAIDDAAGSPS